MTTSTVSSHASVEDRQTIGERARENTPISVSGRTGRRRPGGPTLSSC